MTGQNDENPRLGRNGIGKSSLLDAIGWCLTGRSTRALRGNDVVSRGANSCSVLVEVEVGDEVLQVKAVQNPNSLTLNGNTIDRKALSERLRLNYESFLYAIITPQTGDSFLDLSPGEKLTLFSQILDLDFWIEKSNEAKKRAEQIEYERIACEKYIDQLSGKIAVINSTIKELRVKSEGWKESQANSLSQLKSQNIELKEKIKGYGSEIETLNIEVFKFEEEVRTATGEVNKQNSLLRELDVETFDIDKEIGIIEHKITLCNEDKRRLEKVGATCPTCRQTVDKRHFESEMSKILKLRAEFDANKAELIEAKKEVNVDKAKVNKIASAVDLQLSKAKSKATTTKGNRDALAREISYSEREISRIDTVIKKIKEQTNEFLEMIEEKSKELIKLQQQSSDKEQLIKKLNEDHAVFHYWVTGFKQIRLHIIEETMQTLELEVNNTMTALGIGDWKIQFDIERENQSGGITKGFITLITDPYGYTAKYETLSFGETQRVKLAGCFGLANLIMERAGLVSKVEFYDEITQHMTEEGITDTLNTLRDRAINNDRQIFCIDHQAFEYPDFNGVINIIRDASGSRIQ